MIRLASEHARRKYERRCDAVAVRIGNTVVSPPNPIDDLTDP